MVQRTVLQANAAATLVTRALHSIYKAAAMCTPYLDGTLNVDAMEVTAIEGEAMDTEDAATAPEATVLITGTARFLRVCCSMF